jgi:hypothetical protein
VDTAITAQHPFAKLLPIGRRMTSPTEFVVVDRNGERQRVIGEALDTTFNVLILVYALEDFAVPSI